MCTCDITLFISIPIEFADKRRYWQHVQLDLLYINDRPRIILHAELSSWCLERVSMYLLTTFRGFSAQKQFLERQSRLQFDKITRPIISE